MEELKPVLKEKAFKKMILHLIEGTPHPSRIFNRFLNLIRVFIAASRKFMADDCFTKASSISYTTIMSLIPMLTVALTFYSIFAGVGGKKEEIFNRIGQFMIEHNIKLNIDPIFEVISSLIENAAQIGGVGAAVLIFSATAVLRTIDKSLNDIWQVKKPRPILLQVVYYWAALTLGPILFIAGSTLASQASRALSAPSYRSAFFEPGAGRIWLSGSKGVLAYADAESHELTPIHEDQIDFDNQENFLFDAENSVFKKSEFRMEKTDLAKTEFYQVVFDGETGFACGKDGIFLTTQDGGKNWSLKKLGYLSFTGMALKDSRIIITSAQGFLLHSADQGKTWQIQNLSEGGAELNGLFFFNEKGVIPAGRGTVYLSFDGGVSWQVQVIPEARVKKKLSGFYGAFWTDEKTLWLAGEDGKILVSKDRGKTWIDRSFLKQNYYSVIFKDRLTGYAGGEKGILIYTQNGGEKWQKLPFSDYDIYQLYLKENQLTALGEAGLFVSSSLPGGKFFGSHGKSFLVYAINFLAPFFFIWLFFLMAYKIFPNTRVSFKGAALGASFTSGVWVGFILFFTVYIKSFAQGTFAIYGALAAFPIFLLLIYSSGLIILYGAEVAFVVMHSRLYLALKSRNANWRFPVFFDLAALEKIYRHFDEGLGALPPKKLSHLTGKNDEELKIMIDRLKEKQLILESAEGLLPAGNPDKILLSEVLEKLHDENLCVPEFHQCPRAMDGFARKLFMSLKQKRKEDLAGRTLKDMLKETEI